MPTASQFGIRNPLWPLWAGSDPHILVCFFFYIAHVKLSHTRNEVTSKTCTSSASLLSAGSEQILQEMLNAQISNNQEKVFSGDLLNWTFPAAWSVFYYTHSWLPTSSLMNPSDTGCMDIYSKIINFHEEDVACNVLRLSLPPSGCLSKAATGSILQPACRRSGLGTSKISANSSLGFTSSAFAVESGL